MLHRFTLATRFVHAALIGNVSKRLLLGKLLPVTVILFFGALWAAASSFPGGYDWRVHTISKLTSAETNPQGFRLAALGVMAAMFVALPFAGYVAQHLRAIAPRTARFAGVVFALGFAATLASMLAELGVATINAKTHNFLAHTSAALFIGGMMCCSFCALKDLRQFFPRKRSLPFGLTCYWTSLTILPILTLLCVAALVLLGKYAGQLWVEEYRQSFRGSMVWHLAFWEWIGAIGAFAFMLGTVWLLPSRTAAPVLARSTADENAKRRSEQSLTA
jgi:hypothetical protein